MFIVPKIIARTDILARGGDLLRAAHRTRWALADQVGISGLTFVTNVLLARILGIEEFGRYVLAWAVVAFVQNIQFSAISSNMMSLGPRHGPETSQAYFGAIFVHQGIFGALSAAMTFLAGHLAAIAFPTLGLEVIALPLAAAVLCSQTQDFLRRYFFCVDRPELTFAIDCIRFLGQNLALLAMLIWLPANSATALWILSAFAAIASLVSLFWIPSLRFSYGSIISTGSRGWDFSKWLVASTMLVLAVGNLFSFATGIMLGAAAVGAIKAAQNVVGVAHVVIEVGSNIIPPRATREFMSGGRPGLIHYLVKIAIYGVVIMSLVMGVFVFGREYFLGLFFGVEFIAYQNLVPWWAAIEIAIFLSLAIGSFYRTIEHTKSIFAAHVLSAVVSILAAYPLLSYFGITGAMLGLLTGQVVIIVYLLGMAGRSHANAGT